ncbi:MAG: DnaJ domain-containing protein [Chloroflexi bacterium]|nr:DnaJ domain-containing protein [Chloroflexota bacterium]
MDYFVCPNCNTRILSNIAFCPKCGQKIDIKLPHEIYSKDLYRILQVTEEAEPEVLEAAYKKLAIKYHPDANKSQDATQRMQDLNEAYQVLRDSTRRKNYDQYRRKEKTSVNTNRNQVSGVNQEKDHVQPQQITRHANPSIFGIMLILGMVLFVLFVLGNIQNPLSNSFPATSSPVVKSTATKIPTKVTLVQNAPQATKAESCIKWNNLSNRYKGQRICVYGTILSQKEITSFDSKDFSNWVLIRFDENPATFYIISDYKFNIKSGDCIKVEEILQYDSNGIPFMKVSDIAKCLNNIMQ